MVICVKLKKEIFAEIENQILKKRTFEQKFTATAQNQRLKQIIRML